jgi:hypothetical protein
MRQQKKKWSMRRIPVDSLPSNDVKLVLGNFNAKVGREAEYRRTVGPDSLHNISNDSGVRFIDFAMSLMGTRIIRLTVC